MNQETSKALHTLLTQPSAETFAEFKNSHEFEILVIGFSLIAFMMIACVVGIVATLYRKNKKANDSCSSCNKVTRCHTLQRDKDVHNS